MSELCERPRGPRMGMWGGPDVQFSDSKTFRPGFCHKFKLIHTGFLSHLRAQLRNWAVRPVRAGCYSWVALSLIDSMTLYSGIRIYVKYHFVAKEKCTYLITDQNLLLRTC